MGAVKFTRAACLVSLCLLLGLTESAQAQVDPGPRPGAAGAGGTFPTLNAQETAFFNAVRETFQEVDSVSGGIAGEDGHGLGPTFNANSCAACHAQPDVGGTRACPQTRTSRSWVGRKIPKHCDRLALRDRREDRLVIYRCDAPTRADRCRLGPNQTSASARARSARASSGVVESAFLERGRLHREDGFAMARPAGAIRPVEDHSQSVHSVEQTGCLRAGAQGAGT